MSLKGTLSVLAVSCLLVIAPTGFSFSLSTWMSMMVCFTMELMEHQNLFEGQKYVKEALVCKMLLPVAVLA